jgi:hypothetical protein
MMIWVPQLPQLHNCPMVEYTWGSFVKDTGNIRQQNSDERDLLK